jgi:hypothetical protein
MGQFMDSAYSTRNKVILVKKASGEEEPFATEKLERSLLNAGAKADIIQKIVGDIECWIQPGVTTKKIYTRAFSLLRQDKTTSSLRYRLKQAILELGPTGYPFEILIGKLFQQTGFGAEVGVVVEGKCITHEMDVIATKGSIQHLAECKYHKDQGKQVSIQVPLYVRSRVDDIISKRQKMREYQDFSFTGWVITNTRFSSDSIQYSKCSGLKLLGWNYPPGEGLKEKIEKYKLYPITLLRNLTNKEKQHLLNEDIVICTQLLAHPQALSVLDLSKAKHDKLMKELNDICG